MKLLGIDTGVTCAGRTYADSVGQVAQQGKIPHERAAWLLESAASGIPVLYRIYSVIDPEGLWFIC